MRLTDDENNGDFAEVRQIQAQHADAIAAKFAAGTFSVEFTSAATSRKYILRGVRSEDYAQFDGEPAEVRCSNMRATLLLDGAAPLVLLLATERPTFEHHRAPVAHRYCCWRTTACTLPTGH